ncbi:MAG TPA: type II toxin-antitoxin system RelE/ParE family toxin [Rhizomicrobium sp.]|jgi:phage-related protein
MNPLVSKPVEWVASSYKDFIAFPGAVQDSMGFALYIAQTGGMPRSAKPLKGFGGAGVLEIVEDHRGDAYRAVYTVRFENAVYVLHAFQKKAKKGSLPRRATWNLFNGVWRRGKPITSVDEEKREEEKSHKGQARQRQCVCRPRLYRRGNPFA